LLLAWFGLTRRPIVFHPNEGEHSMAKRFVSLLVVTAALTISSLALAQNPCNPCGKGGHAFHVNDPMNRNTVTFRSEAPLEDIVGTTTAITGKIVFDPMNPDKGGMAQLMVSAAGFTTGIPLRDEHLASPYWLGAEKHPNIILDLKKVNKATSVSKGEGTATFDLDVSGELTINGKTQPIQFVARVTYLKESEMTKQKMDGDLLAVRAEFDVSLAAYGIAGPPDMALIGSKVGEDITVSVSLMGTNAGSAVAANPCNPCGGKKNPCNPCGGEKNPCNPCG
jgi:polyisoprenoid-binding protein YceI